MIFCRLQIFFKINFLKKKSFSNTIRVSNGLDLNHAHSGPEVIKPFYPPTKSDGYSFGVVRPFRPSVRNHISVPIGQI